MLSKLLSVAGVRRCRPMLTSTQASCAGDQAPITPPTTEGTLHDVCRIAAVDALCDNSCATPFPVNGPVLRVHCVQSVLGR